MPLGAQQQDDPLVLMDDADHTLACGRRLPQIEPCSWRFSFVRCRLTVREHRDGHTSLPYGPRLTDFISAQDALDGAAAAAGSRGARPITHCLRTG